MKEVKTLGEKTLEGGGRLKLLTWVIDSGEKMYQVELDENNSKENLIDNYRNRDFYEYEIRKFYRIINSREDFEKIKEQLVQKRDSLDSYDNNFDENDPIFGFPFDDDVNDF